jgi:hypothetical protein
MSWGNNVLWALALAASGPGLGCDESGGFSSDGDSDGDSDADTDTDADTDADTDTDTDASYPAGPYGFTPSMLWDDPIGEWTDDGEVIPNICLKDANGDERCLGDLYGSADYRVLIVDFTSMS